jgi:hypothetical protein
MTDTLKDIFSSHKLLNLTSEPAESEANHEMPTYYDEVKKVIKKISCIEKGKRRRVNTNDDRAP